MMCFGNSIFTTNVTSGFIADTTRPQAAPKSRVFCALTEPKLLLLDEVMAGLRPTETDRMVEVLKNINRSGLTIPLDRTCDAGGDGAGTACAGASPRCGDCPGRTWLRWCAIRR